MKKSGNGGDVLAFDQRATTAKKKSAKKVTMQSSHHLADRMQGYGLKALQKNELQSIYALFDWVANEQRSAKETVQAMTEVRFSVKDVTSLQQKDYDEVIKFLVDLRIDEMRH